MKDFLQDRINPTFAGIFTAMLGAFLAWLTTLPVGEDAAGNLIGPPLYICQIAAFVLALAFAALLVFENGRGKDVPWYRFTISLLATTWVLLTGTAVSNQATVRTLDSVRPFPAATPTDPIDPLSDLIDLFVVSAHAETVNTNAPPPRPKPRPKPIWGTTR